MAITAKEGIADMTKLVWALAILLTIGFAGVALAGPQGGNSQGGSQGGNSQGHSQGDQGGVQNNNRQ
jgi:hypothetical protein